MQLFKKHKVALISAAEGIDKSTSVGPMTLNMLGSFAEFERERCADASDRRRTGRVYGPNTPFGCAVDGAQLVQAHDEQRVLTEMRQARTLGQSFGRVAASLNERGIPTKKGSTWYPATVHSVLTSAIARSAD